ncbi:MAG: hypothetical protein B0D92_02875 [Spirochaeta sp. LUC14_002_19_P3]|nr:MAG: hypothetical protein B0D92_02875 [Spirochaeta sp. LUC14_002_19_P3]
MLTSCGKSSPAWQVLKGNLSYRRGLYQKAILSYQTARDSLETDKDIVQYNLGNVFYALGEGKAALQTWELAEKNAVDADILFRTAFNRGVVYLNLGQYDNAFLSFKRALEINPGDTDAKINLEDALLRISSDETRTGEMPEIHISKSQSLLLDYIKRKEMEEWTAPENESIENVEDW